MCKRKLQANESSNKKKKDKVPANQPTLKQCYAAANKNIIMVKKQATQGSSYNRDLSYKEHVIMSTEDKQLNINENLKGFTIVSILASYKQLIQKKLILSVFLVSEDNVPTNSEEDRQTYIKFRLSGETNYGFILSVSDTIKKVQKRFKHFFKMDKEKCRKYIDFNQCIIVTNKIMEISPVSSEQIIHDMISCFEYDEWLNIDTPKERNDSNEINTSNDDNEIEMVGQTSLDIRPKICAGFSGEQLLSIQKPNYSNMVGTKKHANRNPVKASFFGLCNPSVDDMMTSFKENEKSYIFSKETVNSLVKTLDDCDTKKTLFQNMTRMIDCCHDSINSLQKLIQRDNDSKIFSIPEQDMTKFENDKIMIEGCVSLKKDKYAVALAKSDPPGIISSLISRCSPESWKYCYLSNEDKCKQLNWLLGDPKYDDEERLADGDKKINMLIAHAFRLSGYKSYGYRELQLARKAISQGLCELKRKGKRAQLQKKTDSINHPQESSNDNGDDNFSNAVVVDLDKIQDWEEIDENQN